MQSKYAMHQDCFCGVSLMHRHVEVIDSERQKAPAHRSVCAALVLH